MPSLPIFDGASLSLRAVVKNEMRWGQIGMKGIVFWKVMEIHDVKGNLSFSGADKNSSVSLGAGSKVEQRHRMEQSSGRMHERGEERRPLTGQEAY